ncbi:MAG: TolC family protein [Defluviitaleaceae bacterium]|nr:TolC family protein [Defluviitaleaceae bacterium]
MKKFFAMSVILFLFSCANIFADSQENENEILVLSFEEALEMALDEMLVLRDLEIAIRDVEIMHRDLDDVVKRLRSGAFQRKIIDELREKIRDIEYDMEAMNQNITAQMFENTAAVRSVAGVANDPELGGMFDMAMFGALQSSGMMMGGAMSFGMASAQISAQIENWRDTEFVDDFRDDMVRNLNQIERQIKSLRLNQKVISVSMESALRNILVGIDELEAAIFAMRENLELMEKNILRMTVAHRVGMISANDLNAMRHGFSQAQSQSLELDRNLNSLLQNLNQMLGLPIETEILIEYEREVPEIPEDFDKHIADAVENSPSIRQLQFDIDFARAQRRANTGNDADIQISAAQRTRAFGPHADSENDDVKKIRERAALQEAVERAITAREQAKRTLSTMLRQNYDNLNALHAQEEILLGALEQAQSALAAAEANFTAGRVTQFDVEQTKLAVANAARAVESLTNRKWILGFEIENPVLSGAGGN